MWPKLYKDYPEDTPLKKEEVCSGKGISGCEMHEINGWGNTFHRAREKKRGIIFHLLEQLLGKKE